MKVIRRETERDSERDRHSFTKRETHRHQTKKIREKEGETNRAKR